MVKVIGVEKLAIPAVKVVRFARFTDHRGYFTEQFRQSDFDGPDLPFMNGVRFQQANESFSRAGVIRGLHFQWNPFMGKLVRTIRGRMIDIVMDIRLGSPTYGQAIAFDMPSRGDEDHGTWIWVPPGFAHGNTFTEDTVIEYMCSGEYSPGCEAGISPMAADLDWSLCDPELRGIFLDVASKSPLITYKDLNGHTLASWTADERSANFRYEDLSEHD